MADERAAARRSFGLTFLVGAASAGLAAWVGSHAWADSDDARAAALVTPGLGDTISRASAPLVTSLALVVLACWGVVLVTRGRFRRIVAALGAVASLGLVASAVGAFVLAPQAVRDYLEQRGLPEPEVDRTWWAYAGVVVTLLTLAAMAVAVRSVPRWAEMSSRYDAPAEAAAAPSSGVVADPESDAESIELWKALDRGDDPTDPRA